MLDNLLARRGGLAGATDVLVTGGSAGGLAVYLHADHIAGRLPGARVKALADGGFFLDHPTLSGVPYAHMVFSRGFKLWNSTGGVNAACVAANKGQEERCIFAQHTLPHVATPLYVLEGMYDPWQLDKLVQLSGGPAPATVPALVPGIPLAHASGSGPHLPPATVPAHIAGQRTRVADMQGQPRGDARGVVLDGPSPQCSAVQMEAVAAFGEAMRTNVTAALAHQARQQRSLYTHWTPTAMGSAFVPACVVHCQSLFASSWSSWRIAPHGKVLREHFKDWWVGGTGAAPPLIDPKVYPEEQAMCPATPDNCCTGSP